VKLCKVRDASGTVRTGCVQDDVIALFDPRQLQLTDILHSGNPAGSAQTNWHASQTKCKLSDCALLSPADGQEIWAAGVTYKRSQEARERESQGAARFYDLVYSAARPELFFKAAPGRACGPGDGLNIRRDSKWNVPEPELALVISPAMKIVGYTIGNDMSSRDIEGENPLYLPQAKVYDRSCALGPVITLVPAMPPLASVSIGMRIVRNGKEVFSGTTGAERMKRTGEELVSWLGRENSFPHGAILLTGTGIIPPDDFTLAIDDLVAIEIAGIGVLENRITQIDSKETWRD
jgi:2-dehydro-3-deoxy-D-arabinonate dehydratase